MNHKKVTYLKKQILVRWRLVQIPRFWRAFENLKLVGQTVLPDRSLLIGQKFKDANATFWVIFKHCGNGATSSSRLKWRLLSRSSNYWPSKKVNIKVHAQVVKKMATGKKNFLKLECKIRGKSSNLSVLNEIFWIACFSNTP